MISSLRMKIFYKMIISSKREKKKKTKGKKNMFVDENFIFGNEKRFKR